MKKKLIYFTVLGLLYGTQAMAAVPVTFTADTPAHAADVNSDFSNLDNRATANATAIAANAAAIAANTPSISSNAAAISTNVTAIAANKNAIATNTTSITTNASAIATNKTSTTTNAAAISANTTSITGNANAIAANTTSITTNANNIATNTTAITANATAIANIPGVTIYNFNDYTMDSTVTSKTFKLTGNFCNSTAVQETRDYTRTVNASSTNIVMTRKWLLSDSSVCQWRQYNYNVTATEKTLLGENKFNTAGTPTTSDTLAVPMVVANSTMAKGLQFGSGTTVNDTVNGFTGIFVQTKVALGIEDVTVPANTYTGCLKTSTIRSSDAYGTFQQVSWSCPHVGEVKRIQMSTASGYRIWELSSITP
ncbi:MAG: hypothetical protein P8047_17320 [Gammaproteobacteria bacterium]